MLNSIYRRITSKHKCNSRKQGQTTGFNISHQATSWKLSFNKNIKVLTSIYSIYKLQYKMYLSILLSSKKTFTLGCVSSFLGVFLPAQKALRTTPPESRIYKLIVTPKDMGPPYGKRDPYYSHDRSHIFRDSYGNSMGPLLGPMSLGVSSKNPTESSNP